MAENRIVEAKLFKRGRFTTYPVFQYDYGRVLRLIDPDGYVPETFEMHFGASIGGNSISMLGEHLEVKIPSELLKNPGSVYAWLYLHDTESDGETVYAIEIPVRCRGAITDQEPAPEEENIIAQAITALNTGVADARASADRAEEASESANQAKTDAIAARRQAEEARDRAVLAESAAKDAKNAAVEAKEQTEDARDTAVEALEQAEAARNSAVEAKDAVIEAKEQIDTDKTVILEAKDQAESAKNAAVSAKKDAVRAAEAAADSAQDAADIVEDAQQELVNVQHLIEIQETQPEYDATKLWIVENSEESHTVPTYAEMQSALAEKLNAPGTPGTSGQVLTSDGHGGQSWETPNAVSDVQVNGESIVQNGIANVPIAGYSGLGVVKVNNSYGIAASSDGVLMTWSASSAQVKSGTEQFRPIVPYHQGSSAFYGLAQAAGDTTQSQSDNPVGTYTSEAIAAIKTMLNINDGAEVVRLI